MPISIQTTITLRTPRGVVDLELREIEGEQLVAEGEHALRSGKRADFQFALPGAHANLRGEVELRKVVKLAIGPTRTVLDIVEMNRNQRGQLREWLEAQASLEAAKQPQKKPPPPSIEELRGMRSGSLTSELLEPDSAIGRQALSEAITADPERHGRRSQLRRGVEARRGRAENGEGARKRRRVEVKVAAQASPPIVMVRFNDPERYVAYYWKHLHRDALKVRFDDPELERNTQVNVRLVLPGGSTVKCGGYVRVVNANGFALRLELSDSARSTLRLSAGPRPREI
jgi:hypothetical protein